MRWSGLLLTLVAFAALHAARGSAVTDNVPKYSDLATWGSGNQFDIKIEVGKIPSRRITDPLEDARDLSTCENQEYQNPGSDVCNAPPLQDRSADVIRVTVGLKEGIDSVQCQVEGEGWNDDNRTPTNEATPTHIETRMCYSMTAFTDRPWRKKNKPYPKLSLNCPFLIQKVALEARNEDDEWVTTKFFDFDEVPSATYYVMVHVLTGEEKICGWTSTENVGYILTEVDMGRTGGVIAAAIIFSIFSISFLVLYNIADAIWYKKKGSELTFI